MSNLNSQTVNYKTFYRTDSCPIQSPHLFCYLLSKLMDNSTPGYSCTAMHHVIFLYLFCDGMFIISGVSAFPQPPLSAATSVIDFLHFQECLMATSREQMLTFPIQTKLNNASSCVPFAPNATCFVILI